MEKKYLISICMMVKDEERNLPRTLNALKPLLEKSDVELIIVDTGSSDRSPEIAKEFTDKVYFHQWNRHFSEMRNISISYARGEFLFILDADEMLLNPDDLYKVIKENRNSKFNTMALKIRNLNITGGYTTISQMRIFRNDGEFRYEGAVHNQPKFKHPILDIDVVLEHYGYLFYDEEFRKKKFERTAGILIDELKKNPNNIYYRYQLSKSYRANRDKENALIEIRKAYQLVTGDKELRKRYSYIYGSYASYCYDCNEFEESIKACIEGLDTEPEYVDLYYLAAASHDALGNRKAAIEWFKSFIEIADKFDQLAISKSQSTEMIFNGPNEMDTACLYIANEAFDRQDYKTAYEYVKRVDDDERQMPLYIKVLLKLKKYEELRDVYLNNLNKKDINKIIVETIEAFRCRMTSEASIKLSELFSEVDGLYSLLSRKRTGEISSAELLGAKELKEANFNELPLFYAELFSEMDKTTRQAILLLKKMKKSKIKQFVYKLINHKADLKGFFEEFLEGGNLREDFYGTKLYIGIAYILLFNEASILKNLNIEPSDQYYRLFKRYLEAGNKYVEYLYDCEKIRLFYSTLEDDEDRFFIALRYAREAIGRGEYKAAISYFREAAKANPYMVAYMKKYMDEIFPEPFDVDTED